MKNKPKPEKNTSDTIVYAPEFKYEIVKEPGGENFLRCFSCGTCTAACPVSEIAPEYSPRKIIRMALLGMKEEVLTSPTIWLCTQCYTCYARCPQDVKFTEVMGAIRSLAIKDGKVSPVFVDKIKQLDYLCQLFRRNIVKQMCSDLEFYEKTKKEIFKLFPEVQKELADLEKTK